MRLAKGAMICLPITVREQWIHAGHSVSEVRQFEAAIRISSNDPSAIVLVVSETGFAEQQADDLHDSGAFYRIAKAVEVGRYQIFDLYATLAVAQRE